MKILKSLSTFFCFLLFFKVLHAQDRKFLTPQLKFSAEYDAPASLKNSSGKYSIAKGEVGFIYPLLSRRFALTNALDYRSMVVLSNFNAGYALPDFTFIDTRHQFISGSAGASFIYNSGNKNTWLAGLMAGIAEDFETLSAYSLRFTGYALFKHKVNGDFSYHAGLIYTFVYGRALPLPLLGAVIRTGDKSKIKITLPLSITYMLKTSEFNMLSVFVKPDGDVYQFATQSDTFFASRNEEIVKFRMRNFKSGVSFKTSKSERFQFTYEGGLLFKRTISFTEAGFSSGESFFSNEVKPAPYVKISLRILMGDLKWKRTGDNFLLNDERLDYYDLDDPSKL